jgi:coenzyme F420-reducing hydrogenase alpha subunit
MKTRTIKVDYLARVEGEGALLVKIKEGQVTDVKLKIFELPRFFEPSCGAENSRTRQTSPRASAASARLPIK